MRIRSCLAAAIVALAVAGVASAAVPPLGFSLNITLTPKAAQRLKATHEGITVSASYYADPKPAFVKRADEVGHIDLGVEQLKLPGRAGPARVSGATVNRRRLAWVQGPVKVNVNVYSSRLAGPDNILACDLIDTDVAKVVAAEPVTLHCGLITEDPKTEVKP